MDPRREAFAAIASSVGLGISALFVMFVAGAVTEVPGTNSPREIASSCAVGALYLGFCQFWVAPRGSRGFRAKGRTLVAMILPLLCAVVLIFVVEHGSLVPGVFWLVSGCLGSLLGAMIAGRVGTQSPIEAPSTVSSGRARECRRLLLVGAALLAGATVSVAVGVIPPLTVDRAYATGFKAHGVAVMLGVFAALNLLVAAMMAFVAFHPGARDHHPRTSLGVPAILALLLALLFAFSSGIRVEDPALLAASVILVACAVSDLVAAALVTSVSIVADRASKAGG